MNTLNAHPLRSNYTIATPDVVRFQAASPLMQLHKIIQKFIAEYVLNSSVFVKYCEQVIQQIQKLIVVFIKYKEESNQKINQRIIQARRVTNQQNNICW